jgi:hypothetical protein
LQELINLVLGLWGYALLDLANTDVKPLKEKVLRNKSRVFPPKYFNGLVRWLGTRPRGLWVTAQPWRPLGVTAQPWRPLVVMAQLWRPFVVTAQPWQPLGVTAQPWRPFVALREWRLQVEVIVSLLLHYRYVTASQVEVLEDYISDPSHEFHFSDGSSLKRSASMLSVVHRPSISAASSSALSSVSSTTTSAANLPLTQAPTRAATRNESSPKGASGHVRV